jgi:hypothetical protein
MPLPRASADSAEGKRGVVSRPGNATPPAALVGLNANAIPARVPSDGAIRPSPRRG